MFHTNKVGLRGFRRWWLTLTVCALMVIVYGCDNGGGLDGASSDEGAAAMFLAPIFIDGNSDDWDGMEPLLVDPHGDVDAGVPHLDIERVFLSSDRTFVYVKIDVAGEIPNRDDLFLNYGLYFTAPSGEILAVGARFHGLKRDVFAALAADSVNQGGEYQPLATYPQTGGYLAHFEKTIEFKVRLADIDFDLNNTVVSARVSQGHPEISHEDVTENSPPVDFGFDFFALDVKPAPLIEVPMGQDTAVAVMGGPPPFSVSVKEAHIAVAEYAAGKIIVSGLTAGTTTLTVQNGALLAKTFPVTVVEEKVVRPLAGRWSGAGITFVVSEDALLVEHLELTLEETFPGTVCNVALDKIDLPRVDILGNSRIDSDAYIPYTLSGHFTDETSLNLTLSYEGYDPRCDAPIYGEVEFTANKE